MQTKNDKKRCKSEDSNEFNDEFEFKFDNYIFIRERPFVTCKKCASCDVR